MHGPASGSASASPTGILNCFRSASLSDGSGPAKPHRSKRRAAEPTARPGKLARPRHGAPGPARSTLFLATVEATEDVMKRENLVRKAILEGVDPREAYLKYGKF